MTEGEGTRVLEVVQEEETLAAETRRENEVVEGALGLGYNMGAVVPLVLRE